ncbi:MAG TPA: MlaD family protein [Rubrivivax sp.]|nr:MlaD family protein [Rubrivivax sp.]
MEPDTRYTVIGAVVLALAALAIGAFVWLNSGGRGSDLRFYTVYFEHQSLDGLQVGAAVTMRGITVGRVETVAFEPDSINRVRVVVRVARETPVRENTMATVSRNVVTGIARIRLETPSPPGHVLTRNVHGERYPVIAEGQSGMDQFTDSATRLAASAESVLRRIDQLVGPDNQRAFGELLGSLRDLSQGLNARLGALDRTAGALERSLVSLRHSSDKIGSLAQRLGDSAEPLAREAGATLRELAQAARSLERGVQTLERDSSALLQRGDAALDTGSLELRATTQELRSSAERIARALDRLQDPRAALLGPGEQQLGPGEHR